MVLDHISNVTFPPIYKMPMPKIFGLEEFVGCAGAGKTGNLPKSSAGILAGEDESEDID
jgi:hypothetical protein